MNTSPNRATIAPWAAAIGTFVAWYAIGLKLLLAPTPVTLLLGASVAANVGLVVWILTHPSTGR